MGSEIIKDRLPKPGHRFRYGRHPSQTVELRYTGGSGAHPHVVHIHGGFRRSPYDRLHGGRFCAALTDAGFITATVDYRRPGEPGGGWPGTFEDVREALGFVRALGHVSSTVVTGHSVGGLLALWLAAEERDLDGVVALAAVTCLHRAWELRLGDGAIAELMGGLPGEAPQRYAEVCPQHRKTPAPRILIHGSADQIVPVALSRDYLEERRGDSGGVKLEELPGAGHLDPIDPRTEAWREAYRSVAALSRW